MALTEEEWEQIEALLPEALELAPAARPRFLDRHCPQTLRAEIEALITAGGTGNGVLDRPVTVTAPEAPGPSLAPGEPLGAWRIGALLGSGGMGEVYAAERADGSYEQRVAIKLLKRGIDTQAVLSRFLRERRILARLAHPNIARLLDAGAAPDGRPYLVMERVDGLPIDQWCERQAPPLRRRLELMCTVCEAVYAAHREQIVHRDLKPSNVMVSEAGEVKLLDFGVSKLAGEDGDKTQTVLGSAPLTPDYAAPEQLLGQPVTAATDVYALGLLLYRLLTGELPHSRPSLAAALATAGKDDRITRPSLMLRQKRPASDSDDRRAQARKLDGDLDQIVLKALQRNPARRYASAAELADDLRRHLDGRPVLAQPDSRWYVARKFIVRNWVPVSAATAVTLALVTGLTIALWQARIARAQAQRAEAQAQRAERVKDFVESVFAEQDPFVRSSAQARTPQQMLSEAAARLDQELAGEPDLHAELLDDLGGIQLDIGDLKSSEALLNRAVNERSARFGPRSLEVAESLDKLARVFDSERRWHDEEQAASSALAILREHRDADPVALAHVETELANAISTGNGSPPEAESLFRDALHILEQRLGPDDPETLRTLYYLAEMHEQARQQDLAEAEAKELIQRSGRRYGPQSAEMGRAIALQADVLADADKPAAAVESYRQALALLRPQLGERDGLIFGCLEKMGNSLRVLRRLEEAISTFDEAEHAIPDGNVSGRSSVLRARALAELWLSRADPAERDFREAYEIRRKADGDNSGYVVYLESEWGRGLAAQGKLAQAESVQREALTRLTTLMGPKVYQLAIVMHVLADTLEMEDGRRTEAESLRRQAMAIAETYYPKTGARWATYAGALSHNLAGAHTAAADAEGLNLSAQVVSIFTGSPPDSESFAEGRLDYADFLDRAGRRDEARQQLAAALQLFAQTLNPDAKMLKLAHALQHRFEPA